MSAHTPGPWSITDDHPTRATLHIDQERNAGYGDVAVVYRVGVDDARHEADARLIAASPDLLEALRSLHGCVSYSDTMGCWVLTGNERTRPALEAARRAIAKAEGR